MNCPSDAYRQPGFYRADCMEFMRGFPDGFFDLAIVDPPYFSGPERRRYYGREISKTGVSRSYNPSELRWKPPGREYFDELLRVSRHYIIWGCNYFDYRFAAGRIVWDKCNGSSTFSDAEIAATDLMNSVKLFPYMWNGMQQGASAADGRRAQGNKQMNEHRIHPCQKPVALYTWLLGRFARPGWRILDTHVGSASSLIACHRAGLDYWGCELDTGYFETATERLHKELAQVRMELDAVQTAPLKEEQSLEIE